MSQFNIHKVSEETIDLMAKHGLTAGDSLYALIAIGKLICDQQQIESKDFFMELLSIIVDQELLERKNGDY